MDTKYYLAAALLAPVMIAIEHAVSRSRRIAAYELHDTVNSVSHFLGEMVLMVVLYLNIFLAYDLVRAELAVFQPDASSPLTWVGAFFALDLAYWIGHRACHRVGALWALHAVHHQSHHLNLGVGMRGPWLSALQIAPFMLPLAIAGIPTAVLSTVYAGHTVWKLLAHTRLVGRLGPLEWLLATPSQHRVHHASNARFIDKNFGGALCVWDRLFGTFQEEDEVPVFGNGAPARSWNPIVQNIEPWTELASRARAAGGWRGWFGALIMPPTWGAATDGSPASPPGAREAYGAPNTNHHAAPSVLWRLVSVGVATLAFMHFGPSLPWAPRLVIGGVLVAGIVWVNRPARTARRELAHAVGR
jgi:sterol desaturase/sphingolipid hydroxylase (fatty acid hydroxylase superfamily)